MDSWRDLDTVVEHIAATAENSRISAVAWSMGGVILTRYLGEGSASSRRISCAAALSTSLDTEAQFRWFQDTRMGCVANVVLGAAAMLKTFVASPGTIQKVRGWGITLSEICSVRSIIDLDRIVVCRLHSYPRVEDYYSQNNPLPHLHNIAVPLLVLHAKDDPVTPECCLPRAAMRENPWITLAVTAYGGHIGWTKGNNPLGSSWADALVLKFIQANEGSQQRASMLSKL